MAKGGRKYRLLLYEHMLNRWWPATLWLAPASEYVRDVVATVPRVDGLPAMVDAFRELLLEGTAVRR